jgi:hypothetical protein
MDTPLFTAHLQVEQKQFTFVLEQNAQGSFVRITEEVSGRRNSIIIPTTGLERLRDSLNEMIKSSQSPVGSGPALPLGRPQAATPTPDGPADVTAGA